MYIRSAMWVLSCLHVATLALAGAHPATAPASAPSAEAAALVQRCCARLRRTRLIRFTVELRQTRNGLPLVSPGTYDQRLVLTVAMSRDGRVRITARREGRVTACVLWDGTQLLEYDARHGQAARHAGRRFVLLADQANQPKCAGIFSWFLPSWLSDENAYCDRIRQLVSTRTALERPTPDTFLVRKCETHANGDVSTQLQTAWTIDARSGMPVEYYEEYTAKFHGLLAARETLRMRFRKVHLDQTVPASAFEWHIPNGTKYVETGLAAHPPAVGDVAPRVTLQTVDGKRVDLSHFLGRGHVLIVFWATWCTPCKAELRDLESMLVRHGLNERVTVLAVNVDSSRAALRAFLHKRPLGRQLKLIVLRDGANRAARSAFGVNGLPSTFLLNSQGKILGHWSGWDPSHPPPALEEMRALLK